MRTDTIAQMSSAAASAFFGLCSGLLYDMLRPLRGISKAVGAACDILFCLLCTAAMFITGMAFCGGRPGLWECLLFISTFAAYLWVISPSVSPIFCKIAKNIADRLKNISE